ncbi:hypothetical protein QMO56_19820 [Roseomonas sp. E05]|uniref:hypothetical protein n=1 Tax=Roseomonas sp. E05 TaxID=3046310 RepID=UPI0024BAB068|nr:hypothetical protein [Roseomonas sp. E05]MDJ0390365.1 hypothetical protein [Roseomonas sp. E05]
MPRGTPPALLTHGLQAAVVALSLAGATGAWAQGPEVPHQLPPVASIPLRPDSFDVRAFDPLGMPASRSPAVAVAPPVAGKGSHQEASLVALPDASAGEASAVRGQGSRLFSDGWSRNGFGSLR